MKTEANQESLWDNRDTQDRQALPEARNEHLRWRAVSFALKARRREAASETRTTDVGDDATAEGGGKGGRRQVNDTAMGAGNRHQSLGSEKKRT